MKTRCFLCMHTHVLTVIMTVAWLQLCTYTASMAADMVSSRLVLPAALPGTISLADLRSLRVAVAGGERGGVGSVWLVH